MHGVFLYSAWILQLANCCFGMQSVAQHRQDDSKFRVTCYIICADDLTLVHNVSMLRYGTASKRVSRILIQGKGLVPTQTHYLNPTLQIRLMATQNKSESEWQAVLSPEQVSSICISRNR